MRWVLNCNPSPVTSWRFDDPTTQICQGISRPSWRQAAAICGMRSLLAQKVILVLEMDVRQCDAVIRTLRTALTPRLSAPAEPADHHNREMTSTEEGRRLTDDRNNVGGR